VSDAEWIADLLRHGLLRASFVPPVAVRDLRELTRYRKTLVAERAAEVNRLQKVLESADLKLASVATDVLGASGRAMLDAVLGGEADPSVLADLARGRLRAKLPALQQALVGRVKPHHLIVIGQILAHIDFLDQAIDHLHTAIADASPSVEEAVAIAQTVPGIKAVAAAALIAEIGADITRSRECPPNTDVVVGVVAAAIDDGGWREMRQASCSVLVQVAEVADIASHFVEHADHLPIPLFHAFPIRDEHL